MKTLQLNNGTKMPALGLGTSQLRGEVCTRSVLEALYIGYRHIDTAEMYGNHEAIASALKRSSIPRQELFLTTKVPPSALGRETLTKSCERYLKELSIDYIDLLLIHWPNRNIPVEETLGAMEELKKSGKIRSIGVSNFTAHHLEDTLATGINIATNQVELHPTFSQQALQKFCNNKKIVLTAYAPLGRGADLELPLLRELAAKYNVSVPQVVLNWIIGRGIAAIPKSSSRGHLEDNFNTLKWKMEKEDVARIDALPQEERIFNPSFNEFDY